MEPWVGYYDIFLRGAFGSFLDVLREVSFSPMMAQYLTMLENKGMAADGAYPDENFAREIMQVRAAARTRDDALRLCLPCPLN